MKPPHGWDGLSSEFSQDSQVIHEEGVSLPPRLSRMLSTVLRCTVMTLALYALWAGLSRDIWPGLYHNLFRVKTFGLVEMAGLVAMVYLLAGIAHEAWRD